MKNFYKIYYDVKHLSSGNWVVYSTEYIDDQPGITTVIFQNLNSTDARKHCAQLRKALRNGKREHAQDLANRLSRGK